MRISINARRITGPWGGGIRFVRSLERFLQQCGHSVFRHLVPALDVILVVAPLAKAETASYSCRDVADYRRIYPRTRTVLRVNACDQHRGEDRGTNRAMMAAAAQVDHTVFVSRFIRDLYIREGFDSTRSYSVVRTGVDSGIFHARGAAEYRTGQRMRIVTHHWSSGLTKGWDIYERLDCLLGVSPFNSLFEFTYVGRLPWGAGLQNSRHVDVLDAEPLADELRTHHLYLTASRSEAAGNHFLEGLQCGLPVLYLHSGGTPEYCEPYGLAFTTIDFERKLLEVVGLYEQLRGQVRHRDHTAQAMCEEYLNLFERLCMQDDRCTTARWGPALWGRTAIAARQIRSAWRRRRRAA